MTTIKNKVRKTKKQSTLNVEDKVTPFDLNDVPCELNDVPCELTVITKVKKIRKINPWIEHCKKVRSENPDIGYKDILKLAKESYKKSVKES